MTPALQELLDRLHGLGVTVEVRGNRVAVIPPATGIAASVMTTIVDGLRSLKAEILKHPDSVIPRDSRQHASWLNRIARQAGVGAEQLFNLIDSTFGHRTIGPFALTVSEVSTVAALLRADIGKRSPITSVTLVSEMPVDDAIPISINRKTALGWTDERFSRLCERILGRVGLRSAEDDRRVLAAMPVARLLVGTIDTSPSHASSPAPPVDTNHRRSNPPVSHSSKSRTEGPTK